MQRFFRIEKLKEIVRRLIGQKKNMDVIVNQESLSANQISITSYNILADLYTDQWYFPYCQNKFLIFDYRKLKIVEQLTNLNSDIVCMQEVDHFEDFYKNEFEKLGYECYYSSKNIRNEGLLTVFKKDKFIKLSEFCMMFDSRTPEKLNRNHYMRNNNCQIMNLQHIVTGQKFVIINTHLFWNPSCEEIKLLQISLVLEHLSNTYKEKDNIIICGDFNSMPQSNVVEFITDKQQPNINRIEKIFQKSVKMNDMNFIFNHYKDLIKYDIQSAYENYKGTNKHPELTNYTQKFNGTLDYIFYNSNMKDFELIGIKDIPVETVKKQVGLPSQDFPSDHLPITAYFKIISSVNTDKILSPNSKNLELKEQIQVDVDVKLEQKLSPSMSIEEKKE